MITLQAMHVRDISPIQHKYLSGLNMVPIQKFDLNHEIKDFRGNTSNPSIHPSRPPKSIQYDMLTSFQYWLDSYLNLIYMGCDMKKLHTRRMHK